MKLRFFGEITVIEQDEDGKNEKEIVEHSLLRKLDGRVHDTKVADYLFDGEGSKNLANLNVCGGVFSLEFIEGALFLNVEYAVDSEPDDEQIGALWDFTQGQISDGAGSSFAGDCEDETGLCPIFESEDFKVVVEYRT